MTTEIICKECDGTDLATPRQPRGTLMPKVITRSSGRGYSMSSTKKGFAVGSTDRKSDGGIFNDYALPGGRSVRTLDRAVMDKALSLSNAEVAKTVERIRRQHGETNDKK